MSTFKYCIKNKTKDKTQHVAYVLQVRPVSSSSEMRCCTFWILYFSLSHSPHPHSPSITHALSPTQADNTQIRTRGHSQAPAMSTCCKSSPTSWCFGASRQLFPPSGDRILKLLPIQLLILQISYELSQALKVLLWPRQPQRDWIIFSFLNILLELQISCSDTIDRIM